jgi:hypothetical protein
VFPYWLLFSFFAAGAIEYRRRGLIAAQSAPILVLGGLAISVMIGLRFEVGGDWITYRSMFEVIPQYDFVEALSLGDPAFSLLNWAAGRAGLGLWAVNLVCGLIFSWGLVRFARRQTNPWLAILVSVPYLVIVVAMGYTRQGVAIGIVLAGLSVLSRTSIYRFGLYVLVAATFHKSAVIVLPLVALAASRNRAITLGAMAVLTILLFILLVRDSLDLLMTNYVDAEYSSQGAAIRVLMNLVPAVIFLVYQKRFGLSDLMLKVWRNFSLAALGTVFLFWVLASSTAVDRLALHLIPLQLFVLSRLPEAFLDRGKANSQLVLAVIAYSATIQFIWLNYATHAEYWLPYQIFPFADDTRY